MAVQWSKPGESNPSRQLVHSLLRYFCACIRSFRPVRNYYSADEKNIEGENSESLCTFLILIIAPLKRHIKTTKGNIQPH